MRSYETSGALVACLLWNSTPCVWILGDHHEEECQLSGYSERMPLRRGHLAEKG